MVKKQVTVVLCDHCGAASEDAKRVQLVLPAEGARGRRGTFDACPNCYTTVPLSEWQKLAIPQKPRATRASPVVSVADVKKKARKAPARPRKRVG